ncbi:hypothetical protein FRC12_000433 [Ceratobasidium sp. 428]|nr:hypothetical protein FRC12_000433 [Ceratobasidium sp. 428]
MHLLHPDTLVPCPQTVLSDLTQIYNHLLVSIRELFQEITTAMHLAIDGWTSLLTASFLGIVVFWHQGMMLWCSVLDFIHLTEGHACTYLAEKTLESLEHFGVKNQATPNDSTPTSSNAPSNPEAALNSLDGTLEPLDDIDEGRELFDCGEVNEAIAKALAHMKENYGVGVSQAEFVEARKVLTKTNGFAIRVLNSATLGPAFIHLQNTCEASGTVKTKKTLPSSYVCTQWSSQLETGKTHLELRVPVEMMTASTNFQLTKYQLSAPQWDLLTEMCQLCKICGCSLVQI